eukprot:6440999-Lingulodinium_polyedra.AAC.1
MAGTGTLDLYHDSQNDPVIFRGVAKQDATLFVPAGSFLVERTLTSSPSFGIRCSALDPSASAKEKLETLVNAYKNTEKGKDSSLLAFWAK